MYREITFKNNVILLSVPFAHHTELQNFSIAPRRFHTNDCSKKHAVSAARRLHACRSICPFFIPLTVLVMLFFHCFCSR